MSGAFIGDVRPVDPSAPHEFPMGEGASEWEVYTPDGWRNLDEEMNKVHVIEDEFTTDAVMKCRFRIKLNSALWRDVTGTFGQ